MIVLATIGAKALWLTYIWLGSCLISSWLSERKGYGGRAGLATSLILTFVGVVIWLLWPARDDSRWKLQGPIPRRGGQTLAEARTARQQSAQSGVDTAPRSPDQKG